VEDGRAAPEPPTDPGHRLRRQRDLGDEEDRLPAKATSFRHRAKVDLGLAAAGDPVQQEDAVTLRPHGFRDRVDRGALRRVQVRLRHPDVSFHVASLPELRRHRGESLFDEAGHGAARARERGGEIT
jgi:hypothetical protein